MVLEVYSETENVKILAWDKQTLALTLKWLPQHVKFLCLADNEASTVSPDSTERIKLL